MNNFEKLKELLKQSRISTRREEYAFPRGWNGALDHVEAMMKKIEEEDGEPART